MKDKLMAAIYNVYDQLNTKYKPKGICFDIIGESNEREIRLGKFYLGADGVNPCSESIEEWKFKNNTPGKDALLGKLRTLLVKGK